MLAHELHSSMNKRTNISSFDLATVVADSLQDLLDLGHESVMVDWSRKLDDAEVSRAFSHVLFTGATLEIAVDCAQMRIVRTFLSRSEALLIHGFCIVTV
jgi:hypothetical protein